ncbi:MAG: serine/threonine protein kinase [Thermomicrobiales bacterium]
MPSDTEDQTSPPFADTHGANRQIVAKHYEIDLDRPLGSGGMSIVYLGRDLKARRLVALRTLRPEYRRDPVTRARFRQEARRMAFIQHPNVAHVYDYQENDEAPWAVIEYVPGDSLREIIDDQGPQGIDIVAGWLSQIGDALSHLHKSGLVHLDIKPQNIIVTDDGTIKLIDFGLAQPAQVPQELVGGLAFGTAAYLSPEQASGEAVSSASDVYSLACVIYELLTGQPPFVSEQGEERASELVQAHLHRAPAPPSLVNREVRIPAWVDELLLWALAKRPAQRFDDVRLFADLFLRGAEGSLRGDDARNLRRELTVPVDTHRVDAWAPRAGPEPIPAPRASTRKRVDRSLSRGALPRRLWRLIFALVVANALLAGVLYFQRGTVPGIYEGEREFRNGASALVISETLNVREAPGLSGAALYTLQAGTDVTITGDPVLADNEIWWPVEVAGLTNSVSGYVWQGGIQPEVTTGRQRLEDLIGKSLDELRADLNSRLTQAD